METLPASEGSDNAVDDAAESASIRRYLLRAFLAAGLPVFTGCAYLIGVSFHQSYLTAFRIPYGFFDKQAADYFLFAYYAVTESSVRLWGWRSAGLLLGVILGIYLWKAIVWADRRFQNSERIRRIRAARGYQRFESAAFIPTLVIALGYLVFVLFVLIFAPGFFGSKAGSQRANEHLAAFKLGCVKAQEIGQFCSEILEGDKLVATGFVLSVSDKHVAIYESGSARVVPIGDKTLRARFNGGTAKAASTGESVVPAAISRP